jgi:hypothetical protein
MIKRTLQFLAHAEDAQNNVADAYEAERQRRLRMRQNIAFTLYPDSRPHWMKVEDMAAQLQREEEEAEAAAEAEANADNSGGSPFEAFISDLKFQVRKPRGR